MVTLTNPFPTPSHHRREFLRFLAMSPFAARAFAQDAASATTGVGGAIMGVDDGLTLRYRTPRAAITSVSNSG